MPSGTCPASGHAAENARDGADCPHLASSGVGFLDRIGVRSLGPAVRRPLDSALATLEAASPGHRLIALDAGCGHASPLAPSRHRLQRLVGVDIHRPDPIPAYLDEFAEVDLCGPPEALPAGTFDLVLSNFTLEHFADPPTAIRNLARCLRPGGILLLSTVNRRHPFVDAYLRLPPRLRSPLQVTVKATAADAHPLVGACNDPSAVRSALADAGLDAVQVEMVSNLAHAWGRRRVTFLIGAVGDLLCHTMPGRRSTIVAWARRPLAPEA